MNLGIGVTEDHPGWELVLRQIGVPFRGVDTDHPIPRDAFSVLIVSSSIKKHSLRNIRNYLQAGGALLLEADAAERLLRAEVRRVYIRYLSSSDDGMFSFLAPCDLDRWCTIVSGAQYLKNQQGKPAIAVLSSGKGTAVVLPSGFTSALLDFGTRRRSFPSKFGRGLPSERVSKVSKGVIRRIVEDALMYLYRCCGRPFLHLWYFPNDAASLFSFRVDTDFSRREEVEALYHVCRKHGIRATWFVETKTQSGWVQSYREMKNQEIGYHCYRHRVFPDYRSNREDIRRGSTILGKAGIVPQGYAAPYGEWNPMLGRAIQDHGFDYSSEFGIAHDALPFFPYFGESFSTVLQIPIHPVSVGRLRRAGHSRKGMVAYYKQLIRQKLTLFEPVIIYHHPSHGSFEVFDRLFQDVRKQSVACMSLGEYADWWRRRNQIAWDAKIENGGLSFRSSCGDSSFWLRACLPDGKMLLNPITRERTLDRWDGSLPGGNALNPQNPRVLKKYRWRMLVDDLLHYYRKWKQ